MAEKNTIGEKLKNFFFQLYVMLRTPYVLKNLLGIILFFGLVLGGWMIWLSFYTHHGEKIRVPDFLGKNIEEARELADAKNMMLVVFDSTFRRDMEGGIVLRQNPVKGAGVKRGRKIYLTVTKYTPDEVALPPWRGVTEDYDRYSKKLNRLGVNTKKVKEIFNPRLPSGTILKVFYKGKDVSDKIKGMKVPVGATLGFIVSKSSSQYIPVPDLTCLSKDEAVFLLESSGLEVGEVKSLPGAGGGFIVSQKPLPGLTLRKGDKVDLTVGTKQAAGCN